MVVGLSPPVAWRVPRLCCKMVVRKTFLELDEAQVPWSSSRGGSGPWASVGTIGFSWCETKGLVKQWCLTAGFLHGFTSSMV